MAGVHTLKNTHGEVVLKIYSDSSSGSTEQIELSSADVKLPNETFVQGTSKLTIREVFWGAKKDKQIDVTRVNDPVANTVHGHYYLLNTGHYNFIGFVDDAYANGAIRVIGDGPYHCILRFSKEGYTIT